jgi:fido (protein-threonine AMPylation protein)
VDDKGWKVELDYFLRTRKIKPEGLKRGNLWKLAIGLQDVDSLVVSDDLLDIAKAHIMGKISTAEAEDAVIGFYEQAEEDEYDEDAREADIVSLRIVKALEEPHFEFIPEELLVIHKKLFDKVFDHAGKIRDYDIYKKEWVLRGDSVDYAPTGQIRKILMDCFEQEKGFPYDKLSKEERIRHIEKFASKIWAIHPFFEGNTRTTAVFVIKFLNTFGYEFDGEYLADATWYFRNALVRANYRNDEEDVKETMEFLDIFFDNMYMNGNHELKNRHLRIHHEEDDEKDK